MTGPSTKGPNSLIWMQLLPAVMSCHVMSCHVMSCHVMSCHVITCHVKALAGRSSTGLVSAPAS